MPSLLDVLSGIGSALDTYSGAGSVRDLIAGENPWDQFIDPFNEEKRVSGRQMLENRGWVGENEDQGWVPDLGDLGGFAVEALLDPTNLIGGIGLAKRLMGISKAKAANRGIEAANALSREQRAMGFMPEEVAKLTKIVDETGQPKKMYHGTPHAFDKFESDKLAGDALYGPGVYTTDSPAIANGYASTKGSVYEQPQLRIHPREFRETLRSIYETTPDDKLKSLVGWPDTPFKSPTEIRSELLESAAKLPDEGLLMERGVLQELGHDTDQWIRGGRWLPQEPNVRMHYIDSRKPLDMSDDVPFSDLPPILHNAAKADARKAAREAIEEAKYRKELLGEYALDAVDALDGPSQPVTRLTMGDLRNSFRGIARNEKALRDAKATIARRFPERNIGGPLGGEDVYEYLMAEKGQHKPAVTQVLKDAGFDAIRHRGGNDTHNVVIALDPKNVYLPYIAKELQDLKRVASPNSLLASLAGYNALAHSNLVETDE